MTDPTSTSLLMGGASFFTFAVKNQNGQFVSKPYGPNNPTKVSGTVAAIGEPQQQTDYNSGALLTWTDGKPRLQFSITLDVDWDNTVDWANPDAWQRVGPADASDTQRAVMIKQSSQLQAALRDVIKGGGGTDLRLGAYVTIELMSEQASSKGNPQKIYSVIYKPPAQGVVMNGGGQPQAQSAQIAQSVMPQQQVAAPVQQAPVPATQPTSPATTASSQQGPFEIARKLLHELRLPAEQVAATTGLTVEQVNAIPPF